MPFPSKLPLAVWLANYRANITLHLRAGRTRETTINERSIAASAEVEIVGHRTILQDPVGDFSIFVGGDISDRCFVIDIITAEKDVAIPGDLQRLDFHGAYAVLGSCKINPLA